MKPAITVRFMNDSSMSQFFKSCHEAIEFARTKVSYSGGRVAKVYLTDEYGHNETLWQHDWDDASKHAGLHCFRR
jgi:hypothetical protein